MSAPINIIRNSRALFFSISLPQIVLFLLTYNTARILWPSLESKATWLALSISLTVMLVSFTLYAVYLQAKKREIGLNEAVVILVSHASLLYIVFALFDELVPPQVRNFMVDRDEFMSYIITCLAPALFHGLLLVTDWLTPRDKPLKAYKSFLAAIAVPLFAYLYFVLLVPLHRLPGSKWFAHAQAVIGVSAALVFLLFLIRTVFIMIRRRKIENPASLLVFKVFFCLLFPLAGLYLNDHELTRFAAPAKSGIFGDFSHPMFYILAVVTGALLLLPQAKSRNLLLLQLAAEVICFSYTCYFFFVFLPFLPLSLVGLFIYGLGILMVTPTVLALVHGQSILNKWRALIEAGLHRFKLLGWAALAFCLLPMIVVALCVIDRGHLHRALDYAFAADLSRPQVANFNTERMLTILERIKKYNQRSFKPTPVFTPLYRWLVLDNLTLTSAKLQQLEMLAGLPAQKPVARAEFTESAVRLAGVTSLRKNHGGYTATTLHLVLKNPGKNQDEFRTRFKLPPGAIVSDYYLRIGEKDEPGILSEKKAATFIYQSIVSARKDPGLLRYVGPDELELRVFPLEGLQTRYTGFTILHAEDVALKLRDRNLNLKAFKDQPTMATSKGLFISNKQRALLPRERRGTYYHFLLDYSARAEVKKYPQLMKNFLSSQPSGSAPSKISVVNTDVREVATKAFAAHQHEQKGGFFLERALAYHLNQVNLTDRQVPYFVIISSEALPPAPGLSGFRDRYFDFAKATSINPRTGQRLGYRLFEDQPLDLDGEVGLPEPASVFKYDQQVYYLGGGFNFLKHNSSDNSNTVYEQALEHMARSRELTYRRNDWLKGRNNFLQQTFKLRLLDHHTSFIVVETESQKRRLQLAQKQILLGKAYFDYADDTRRMSEPAFWVLLIVLLLIITLSNKKGILHAVKNSFATIL